MIYIIRIELYKKMKTNQKSGIIVLDLLRFLFVAFCLFLVGYGIYCIPQKKYASHKDLLNEGGYYKENPVFALNKESEARGSFSGYFSLLGTGNIQGEYKQGSHLQFSWGRNEKEFFVTTLPYEEFRFIIDDSKDIPTVKFVFDKDWLNRDAVDFGRQDLQNANALLQKIPKYCHVGIEIRISSKDLQNEPALPKLK